MQGLELRIPPVALFLVAAAAMGGLALALPGLRFDFTGQLLAASIVLLAAGLVGLAGVRVFARHETTVNPLRPERASRLVAAGIYRYSRNPMYLALALALAAWAIWLGSWPAVPVVPAFVLAMNRWQIRPEERALATLFGAEYEAYCRRVRRWL